jgi:hypothetical protein
MVNQNFGKKFNGYSPLELLQIEAEFLKGCGYSIPLDRKCIKPKNSTDKEILFNGLCKVVEFLCILDGVKNVMDYSKLFEFKKEEKPILSD